MKKRLNSPKKEGRSICDRPALNMKRHSNSITYADRNPRLRCHNPNPINPIPINNAALGSGTPRVVPFVPASCEKGAKFLTSTSP